MGMWFGFGLKDGTYSHARMHVTQEPTCIDSRHVHAVMAISGKSAQCKSRHAKTADVPCSDGKFMQESM